MLVWGLCETRKKASLLSWTDFGCKLIKRVSSYGIFGVSFIIVFVTIWDKQLFMLDLGQFIIFCIIISIFKMQVIVLGPVCKHAAENVRVINRNPFFIFIFIFRVWDKDLLLVICIAFKIWAVIRVESNCFKVKKAKLSGVILSEQPFRSFVFFWHDVVRKWLFLKVLSITLDSAN